MSSIACGSSADRTTPPATTHPVVWSLAVRFARVRRPATRIALMAAVGVVASSLLAACGGSGVHAQAGPTPSASITTPSPVATPKAPSNSTQAAAAAVGQVRKYERLLSELAIHPGTSLDRLYAVSARPDVVEEISSLNGFREARDRQIGVIQVISAKTTRVVLAPGRHSSGQKDPTVAVTACLKVSGVRGFGPNGKSIVPKNRKPYLLAHLTLTNAHYPDESKWLVSKVSDREVRSCPA